MRNRSIMIFSFLPLGVLNIGFALLHDYYDMKKRITDTIRNQCSSSLLTFALQYTNDQRADDMFA